MTVGIVFMGGSTTAMLGAACNLNWLKKEGYLEADADIMFATCSGGTLGTTLFNTVGDKAGFPTYDPEANLTSISELDDDNKLDGKVWFAENVSDRRYSSANVKDMIVKFFTGQFTEQDAWKILLEDGLLEFSKYGVKAQEINPGKHPWYPSITYAYEKGTVGGDLVGITAEDGPIGREMHIGGPGGYYIDGVFDETTRKGMGLGWREMTSDKISLGSLTSLDVDRWTAVEYSTHIASYLAFNGAWNYSPYPLFPALKKFVPLMKGHYFSDGGSIEGTGMTTALQQKADSMVVFFWKGAQTGIGPLFGVGNGTLGQPLDQVFQDNGQLGEAYANLTNSNLMYARMDNVQVLANSFYGIESYTLKTLMMFNDQQNPDGFLDSFKDPTIKTTLAKEVPDFPYQENSWGMPWDLQWSTLSANMYCMLQEYKMDSQKDALKDLFGATK